MISDPRNRNLNSAYRPKWAAPEGIPTVNPGASGDTQFDPLMGTGWDHWLDTIGAKNPGGVKLAGGRLPKDAGPTGQSPDVLMRLNSALDSIRGGGQAGYVGNPKAPGRGQLDAELRKRFPGMVS